MAYTIDGKGPYPDKAGEYCGNHYPDGHIMQRLHESPQEAERHHEQWLSQMRFGRPHPCHAGSTREMEAQGYVGLYLKEDSSRHPLWEDGKYKAVPTPECLKEPLSD